MLSIVSRSAVRGGRYTLCAIWVVVMGTWARADEPKADRSAASEYEALVAEFRAAEQEFFKQYRAAENDADRQKLYEKYPVNEFLGRFLAFAEKHPKEPAAVDALIWVATRARATDKQTGEAWNKAVDTLRSRHIESEKIGSLLQTLVYSESPKGAALIRDVLEKSSHREARGQAAMALARLIKRRAQGAQYLRGDAKRAEQFEAYYGKEHVRELLEMDVTETLRQAEGLFEQVVREYGDVPSWRGTLGKAAKGELFELRHLAIGKVAPEIEGEDIDGETMKLSDYRGKVVVLDFWGHW